MPTTQQDQDLHTIGKSAYESIAEMVAALECDYERLQELKNERADLVSEAEDDTNAAAEDAREAVAEWDKENGAELAELIEAAGECESREDAVRRIEEDPLSLEVRSGWTTPGEPMEAEEFRLLLGTGGPAVQIRGELGEHHEPDRAWLEVQDWFKPWTQYLDASQEVLLTYCRVFYFGD